MKRKVKFYVKMVESAKLDLHFTTGNRIFFCSYIKIVMFNTPRAHLANTRYLDVESWANIKARSRILRKIV